MEKRLVSLRAVAAVPAAIVGLGLVGCGDDASTNMPCSGSACADLAKAVADLAMSPPPPPPDLSGARNTKFVINRLLMPDPNTPSLGFTYDVDGSGRDRNQLGLVISTLKDLGGTDPQITVDASLEAGEVIQLLQLSSTDPDLISDTAIGLSGWLGTAAPGTTGATLFAGNATVGVDAASEPKEHRMVGAIASSKLSTGHLPPAAMPLRFPLPGQKPVPLTIYGVHVEGGLVARQGGGFNLGRAAAGSWGLLSGAISSAEIHGKLIPAVANLLQSFVDAGGAEGKQIAGFFDTNKDGKITAQELEDNQTVQSLLAPDEDLFLEDGTLAPNQDKKRDSLSFGLGFTAVPIDFPDQD